MKICVVGMGKIGLPLAVQFASKGYEVVGTDINIITVAKINAAQEPFPGEEELDLKLKQVINNGKFSASTSTAECVKSSQVVVVIVPLYVSVDGEPDFSSLINVCEEISKGLQPGTLVVFETTLPVGTTRNLLGRVIQEHSGLIPGVDFHLVFSPERVLTGRVFSDLRKYPKIVGGVSQDCANAGVQFYSTVLDFDPRPELSKPNGVWNVGTAETAEMIKLAETTYRDVNIALSNQFAKFADSKNIDILGVIEAANSQPFSHLHQPGIAVGGHCIPVYPHLYLFGDPGAALVRKARITNSGMPEYAVEQIVEKFGKISGEDVLVLGASYRSGVKELAYSGVFPLVAALESAGANVEVYDPLFNAEELSSNGLVMVGDSFDKFKIAVIQNDSPEFINLILNRENFKNLQFIYDGRNLLRGRELVGNVKKISIGGA
jgi:nucleotide sugar dehydrogenase